MGGFFGTGVRIGVPRVRVGGFCGGVRKGFGVCPCFKTWETRETQDTRGTCVRHPVVESNTTPVPEAADSHMHPGPPALCVFKPGIVFMSSALVFSE